MAAEPRKTVPVLGFHRTEIIKNICPIKPTQNIGDIFSLLIAGRSEISPNDHNDRVQEQEQEQQEQPQQQQQQHQRQKQRTNTSSTSTTNDPAREAHLDGNNIF